MILSEQDRPRMHQQFAKGLSNLIEGSTPPSPEPLTDPKTSFVAFLHQMHESFGFYHLDPSIEKPVIFGAPAVESAPANLELILRYRLTAASESKWFDQESVLAPEADENSITYAALSTIKRSWINDDEHPTRRFNGLMVAAFIAAQYLPEDYSKAVKPKKQMIKQPIILTTHTLNYKPPPDHPWRKYTNKG